MPPKHVFCSECGEEIGNATTEDEAKAAFRGHLEAGKCRGGLQQSNWGTGYAS